jgi:hypothetical protein
VCLHCASADPQHALLPTHEDAVPLDILISVSSVLGQSYERSSETKVIAASLWRGGYSSARIFLQRAMEQIRGLRQMQNAN